MRRAIDLACRCNRSLAVICALFASLAVSVLVAEDRCLDAGGRVSDAGWACELASGATSSLWDLVSVPGVVLAFLVVGVPVYLLVGSLRMRADAGAGPSAPVSSDR